MPSIAAYTPYETLKFCQSIARHGTDTPAFEEIAAALNQNQIIRDDETYDATKFTSDALHTLYNDLLSRERAGSRPQTNGEVTADSTNPRKRKASASPEPDEGHLSSEELLIHSLVEKLYAKFREEVIKEIRKDEADIEELERDVKQLQQQEITPKPEPASSDSSHKRQGSRTDVASLLSNPEDVSSGSREKQEDNEESTVTVRPAPEKQQIQPDPNLQRPPVLPSQHSPSLAQSTLSSSRTDAQHVPRQQPQNLQQHPSPGAFHRQLPPPSPQRPGYASSPSPHGFMPGPPSQPVPLLPPPPGMQHMPPPMEYPNQKRPSASTPGRGSPLPPQQQQHPHHQYQHYPPYQQPPQWPQPYPPQHGYPPHMPYPNQPYYAQPPRQGSPYQTPHHSPYQPYPHTAPMPYPVPAPQGWHQSPVTPGYPQARSAGMTPIAQSNRQTILRSSGSSTPWRRRALQPGQPRPNSPTRPDRDVSPLTDTEEEKRQRSRSKSPTTQVRAEETPTAKQDVRPKRGRPPSKTPSAMAQSRSQSVISHKSDTPAEKPSAVRMAHQIKPEAPSTPVPASSSDVDQSQRGSGRRGRPRKSTVTSKPEIPKVNAAKRKRESVGDISVTPPPSQSIAQKSSHRQNHNHDPSLVLASKNFSKTSQFTMSEIMSHKFANLFAKPLTDKEIPGYSNLVLRPQDLKSVKTAVGKGSRAAVAAIEVLEEQMGKDIYNTDTKNAQGEGSVGGGMYLIKKTEDIVPPKGIVNSGQLEMELMRIFANAIMFNQLPSSERGFGHNLRLRRNGGDVPVSDEVEAESTSDEEGSLDDGGIIPDARSMFNDVLARVKGTRDMELERVEGPRQGGVSGRQGSVSSAVHDDDTASGTPTAGEGVEAERGSLRKRRRVGE